MSPFGVFLNERRGRVRNYYGELTLATEFRAERSVTKMYYEFTYTLEELGRISKFGVKTKLSSPSEAPARN